MGDFVTTGVSVSRARGSTKVDLSTLVFTAEMGAPSVFLLLNMRKPFSGVEWNERESMSKMMPMWRMNSKAKFCCDLYRRDSSRASPLSHLW